MAIPYRKEITKSDGRKLVAGGPRDQQRRVQEEKDQTVMINALRDEIKNLRSNTAVNGAEFTGEQVDDAIRKAVTETLINERKNSSIEIEELRKALEEKTNKFNELNGEVGIFREKVISLTIKVKERDESIAREIERSTMLLQQLTTYGTSDDGLVIETDRPKMEPTFIDPLKKDAGEKLVPHIQVDDIKNEKKEKMESKVNKLRDLMGKLPNNRD